MERTETIIVDVDGVILNFAKAFAIWWNENQYDEIKLPDNPHDWHFDHPNIDKINQGLKEYLKIPIIYDLMEPNIPKYLNELRKKYIIHLVTAFPIEYQEFRIANLKAHNIIYDDITFADGHKIDLVNKIKPIALIEDSPKNIIDFIEHGYIVFVPNFWNYTKNLQYEHYRLIFYPNWDELIKLIGLVFISH